MNLKPRPNHRIYLDILRRMTPAQRLQKSFELTDLSRQRFKDRLHNRHPELSETELHQLFLQKLIRFQHRKSDREMRTARRIQSV